LNVILRFAAGSKHLQTPDHLKTPSAQEAFNPNGLSQRTIRLLKDAFPDVEVRCVITSCCFRLLFLAWVVGVHARAALQQVMQMHESDQGRLPDVEVRNGCCFRPDW
jgi:hypothetical protein